MNRQETLRDLNQRLMALKGEPTRFFCESDNYCESVGCDGLEDCEYCDNERLNDDWEDCEHCKGSNCEEHEGGVLSVEPEGEEFRVVLCTGGPHIELDTREYALIGEWWNASDRVRIDNDTVNEVRAYWRELYPK